MLMLVLFFSTFKILFLINEHHETEVHLEIMGKSDYLSKKMFPFYPGHNLLVSQNPPINISLFSLGPKNLFFPVFLKTGKSSGKASNKNVPWNYIEKVVFPRSLKNKTAGKIPEYLLKPIRPKFQNGSQAKLHFLAANAWHALRDAAAADGIKLKPTSAGDGYRSLDSQLRAFKVRFVDNKDDPNVAIPYVTRTFEGKVWYLKKGFAPLASPGTSNHNWGLAVDIFSASQPDRLNWLIKNVKKFGFSWELVPEEPWHIRYWAGDNIPEAVQDWMNRNPTLAFEVDENVESHNLNLQNH